MGFRASVLLGQAFPRGLQEDSRAKHYSEDAGMFFRNVPTSPLLSGPSHPHRAYSAEPGSGCQSQQGAFSSLGHSVLQQAQLTKK